MAKASADAGRYARDYADWLLVGALAFCLGPAILLLPLQFTNRQRLFVWTPEFLEWALVIGAETGVAALGYWVALSSIKRSPLRLRLLAWPIFAAVVICLLLIAPLGFVSAIVSAPLPHDVALPGYLVRLALLVAINFGAAGCLVVAVAATSARAALLLVPYEHGRTGSFGNYVPAVVEKFLVLREELQRLLNVFGMMVSLFVLEALLLRSALRAGALAAHSERVQLYSPETVILVGAYLTGVLALVFGPAYAELLRAERTFRDHVLDDTRRPNDPQSWKSWYDGRKTLDDAILLRVSLQESFSTGVAVLSPFLASLLTILTRSQ
jgi:hypothetical protein